MHVMGIAALAAGLLAAAPADGPATDPPADGRNASPTILLGDKTADELCLTAFSAPSVLGQRSCREQQHDRLDVNRARYAQVTLRAPAERLLADWYEAGALRRLTAVQTGALRWNLTLPPASGRLILRVSYGSAEIPNPSDVRLPDSPQFVTSPIGNDWKISVRRAARAAARARL